MCTRGIWQLKTLAITYCERGGSSGGVRCTHPPASDTHAPVRAHLCPLRLCCIRRQYLEKMLVPFARANPQIEIVLSRLPWGKHPFVRGKYLADGNKMVSIRNYSATQVATAIQQLRDSRPIKLRKWDKPFRTTPSIQGDWAHGNVLDRPHAVASSAGAYH